MGGPAGITIPPSRQIVPFFTGEMATLCLLGAAMSDALVATAGSSLAATGLPPQVLFLAPQISRDSQRGQRPGRASLGSGKHQTQPAGLFVLFSFFKNYLHLIFFTVNLNTEKLRAFPAPHTPFPHTGLLVAVNEPIGTRPSSCSPHWARAASASPSALLRPGPIRGPAWPPGVASPWAPLGWAVSQTFLALMPLAVLRRPGGVFVESLYVGICLLFFSWSGRGTGCGRRPTG